MACFRTVLCPDWDYPVLDESPNIVLVGFESVYIFIGHLIIVRNHFVQRAIQGYYSDKGNRSGKVKMVHIAHKTGWSIKAESNMHVTDFYPSDIEQLFNNEVERPAIIIFNKIINSKHKVSLQRSEVDSLKMYVALQAIRTPKAFLELTGQFKELPPINASFPSFVESRRPGENDNDYYFGILREAMKTPWNKMRESTIPEVRYLAYTFDRFVPIIIHSNEQFILPDSGVYDEDCSIPPIVRDWREKMECSTGVSVSSIQAIDMVQGEKRMINCRCLPFHPNYCLMFVEDNWRIYWDNPTVKPILTSDILGSLSNKTRVHYVNYKRKSTKKVYIETLWNYWDDSDRFDVTYQNVEPLMVNRLNCLALDACDVGFCFKDLGGIENLIESTLPSKKYESVHDTLSFIYEVDFDKSIPKEELEPWEHQLFSDQQDTDEKRL